MITNTDFLTKKYFTKRLLTKKQKWIYYPPPPPEFFDSGQLLRYCEKINPQRIRTDKDVRGYVQKRVFCEAKTLEAQECTGRIFLSGVLRGVSP